MTFTIPLADPRVKLQQSTALHLMVAIVLCAVGLVSGVLFWFTEVSPTVRSAYVPLAIFGSVCFAAGLIIGGLAIAARRRLRDGRKGRKLRFVELGLLVVGAILFLLQGWNFPALLFAILATMVLLALLGEGKGNSTTVGFDEQGIHRPFALRSRNIPWHDVRRALLRHGTLTIDLVDNRLFQYSVPAQAVDAEIFEAWAAAQVENGKVNRPKNDW
jgi:hypothetical protein